MNLNELLCLKDRFKSPLPSLPYTGIFMKLHGNIIDLLDDPLLDTDYEKIQRLYSPTNQRIRQNRVLHPPNTTRPLSNSGICEPGV